MVHSAVMHLLGNSAVTSLHLHTRPSTLHVLTSLQAALKASAPRAGAAPVQPISKKPTIALKMNFDS